jgi:hypothetical protein
MKQNYLVKITFPDERERLLAMNEETPEIAIMAAKLHLYRIMTEGVKLSSEQAAQEIDNFAFAIADEEDRLRYFIHGFNPKEVVRCYQK